MATVTCILGTVVLLTLLLWTNARVFRNSRTELKQKFMKLHELKQKLEFGSRDGDTTHVMTRLKHSGAFSRDGGQWPRSRDGNVYVPCVIDDGYSSVAKAAFMMGFVLFHLSTCIRFVSRTNETDFLHIQPSTGCRSVVGRQGGPQPLGLKFPECFELGTIHHELLHALGFHHEHNRWDRDQYVRVLWRNIHQRDKREFKRRLSLNERTPYDYSSIMHYSRLVGSKNGLPTMTAVQDGVEFGTSSSMSPTDVERVNKVYCS